MNTSRRNFFKILGVGAAGVAVSTLIDRTPFLGNEAFAEGCTRVPDKTDPMYGTTFYVNDATKADPKKRKDKTAFCENCQLYQTAKAGKVELNKKQVDAAPCPLFGKKGTCVPAKAWCNSWVKKV